MDPENIIIYSSSSSDLSADLLALDTNVATMNSYIVSHFLPVELTLD